MILSRSASPALLRPIVAAAFLFSILMTASLAVPRISMACSCMQPQPIATYAEDPATVVMQGTVRNIGPDQQGTFQVERWYQGEVPSGPIVPVRGGNGADCGLFMTAGQQLLVVAYRGEDGILQPSICAPSGDLSTPEGRALVAEAVAAFGPGIAPGEPGPPSSETPGGIDLATVLIVGFVGLVGLVLVLGAVVLLRRDSGKPEAGPNG